MKEIYFLLLILLTCASAFCLPVGNPAEPSLYHEGIWWGGPTCERPDPWFTCLDDFRIRIGYAGDFVFNRNLKIKKEGLDQGHHIRETRINTNAGYLALNFSNWVDLFGTVGASNIRLRTRENSWFLAGTADGTLFSNTSLSWSAGARTLLWKWRCFTLGIEGQYFRTCPRFNQYISWQNGIYTYPSHRNKIKYEEWQAGGGLSYTINTFLHNLAIIPYIAGKWSWVRLNTHHFQFVKNITKETLRIFDLRASKRIGFAMGTTFIFCHRIGFTAEGRFGDEKALYINGELCF